MEVEQTSFSDFIITAFTGGKYSSDDVVAFVIPLVQQVITLHEAGKVAPFDRADSLYVTNNRVYIREQLAHAPVKQPGEQEKFGSLQRADKQPRNSVSGAELTREEENVNTLFLRGYQAVEIAHGQHDELSDIFCLGLIIGSISSGLNFYDASALTKFVAERKNLGRLNDRLHPNLANLVNSMTEPDRSLRVTDIYEVFHKLVHYRYADDQQQDFTEMPALVGKDQNDRNRFILGKLQGRLYDTSRRNRLLYYKSNKRFINLSLSSVPFVLDFKIINPDELFTWNADLAKAVVGLKEIVLNKYLRFEDHWYAPGLLDKVKSEAKFNVQEYGFSQLKLVVAFLNWNNLKDEPDERISSPLLLLQAELRKNKKVREDQYILQVTDHIAEVNPVLAYQLKSLYGIALPDVVDLEETSMEAFYQQVKSQVEGASQGVQLHYYKQPAIASLYKVAKETAGQYRKPVISGEKARESDTGRLFISDTFEVPVDETPTEQPAPGKAKPVTEAGELDVQAIATRESPYSWQFDVCNIVLGNFNYKKMSLVRDYDQVLESNNVNEVFRELFGNKPRKESELVAEFSNPDEWHHVIAADPTQTEAVLRSRTGENYIIQGPPGTGKSQTITNLVADFVAQGKTVLFVCEKRAALDVVYHRLKQTGLDALCCYIHDSQSDKRAFIKDLKETYENLVGTKVDLNSLKIKRAALVNRLTTLLDDLQHYHTTQLDITPEAGLATRQLLDRLVELSNVGRGDGLSFPEPLPLYNEWVQFGSAIYALGAALENSGSEPVFAEHPFHAVNEQVFLVSQPKKTLGSLLQESKQLLGRLTGVLQQSSVPVEYTNSLEKIKELVKDAALLQPLADTGNLRLVTPQNEKALEFERLLAGLTEKTAAKEAAEKLAARWINRWSYEEVISALELAQTQEGSFFSFLNTRWRKLKKQLYASYDFSSHAVAPACVTVLEQLRNVYQLESAINKSRKEIERGYGLTNPFAAAINIQLLRKKLNDPEVSFLLNHETADNLVTTLNKLGPDLQALDQLLSQCLYGYSEHELNELTDLLENVELNLENVDELLAALREFARLPQTLKLFVRSTNGTPEQLEQLLAEKTLSEVYRFNKTYEAFDAAAARRTSKEVESLYEQLLTLNATCINATIHEQFLQHVELSNIVQSQLSADQKQFKKTYADGRKILENEFGKSMRYKSIRELLTKESGLVMKDLKPVWLMSPLSVSDSLPIAESFFDVVIYDEASQITMEEGIPALFRAPQTIIVGDDKQMPPTNFFGTSTIDPDDLDNDGAKDEFLSADAESLLVLGSRTLNSSLLSWHYRSRSETLISYSNHAFYGARLLTIPDKTVHHNPKPPIKVSHEAEGASNSSLVLDNSISFHHLSQAVYQKRSNPAEAAYIANMVRDLLSREVPDTIGIVAFSQEQQHTIELALEKLAAEDKTFEQLLEKGYNRTEKDQFVGLIIKNLENIQGDERDIIIMSICYGYDANRKMLMNFGPINRKGGEKRLNVIFSRAKKHMAVVSSILHHDIKNEYNEGANYLRRFLQYAGMISEGKMSEASNVLGSLVIKKSTKPHNPGAVSRQLRAALEAKGYVVAEGVGQSDFKCSLAVKADRNDDAYSLGIMIDDDSHYANNNVLEQYIQRPAVLKSFGWKVVIVLGKDWFHEPEAVLNYLVRELTTNDTDLIKQEPVEVDTPVRQPSSTIKLPYAHLDFTSLEAGSPAGTRLWEIATDEKKIVIRFGKADGKKQLQVKTFSSFQEAVSEKEKLVQEKLKDGYTITVG